MELNYYMIIITNLCIGITYLFSIILIIDELYNIGFFTFNYTYQYNYGSFISKFNNHQTIEYETNRFNVYNNIKFIFKDIFNKSYFNYLLIIVATLITILCAIAYAVYFYFKFIIEQPQECSFEEDINLSFPKQILKCLCNECHKLLPNCTSNYFIAFILIIIIPLSYIFKTVFNINFTPNTDNVLFGFLYICVFLLLIFYYSFNLFNRKTEYKYKDLIVYSLFTLIFISSGYIYKYIYSTYNNINLNTSNDISTIYDIYKQSPPIKPKPIEKPLYKGKDIISLFKYNENDKDPEYKIKKTIVDDYHKSMKTYDNDMKHYNVRYNAYTNALTSSTLGDKTNYFDIAINILGLNNYMHIYLIILIIISLVIYNIYNDDISYVCFIYLLTMLITLTIMNSILYYNTYINKYLIYEPMAHYKNDITNANTALNLELNPSSGVVFYNKLINNDKSSLTETNSDIKNGKEILEDIKKLKDIKYYTSETTSNINTDISTYNNFGLNIALSSVEDNISDVMFLYDKKQDDKIDNPLEYLLNNCCISINSIFDKKIKIEKIKYLTFKFSTKDINVKIPMSGYYKYHYYLLRQLNFILNKETINDTNRKNINEYKNKLSTIISSLDEFKDIDIDNNMRNYETQLKKITFTFDKLLQEIDRVIMCCTDIIDLTILNKSQQKAETFQLYIDAVNTAINDVDTKTTTLNTINTKRDNLQKNSNINLQILTAQLAVNKENVKVKYILTLLEKVRNNQIPNDLKVLNLYIHLEVTKYLIDNYFYFKDVHNVENTSRDYLLSDKWYTESTLIPYYTAGLHGDRVPINKNNVLQSANDNLATAEKTLKELISDPSTAQSELNTAINTLNTLSVEQFKEPPIINNIPIYTNANLNLSDNKLTYTFLLSYNDINYNRTYINYNVGDLIVNNKYELPNLIVNDDGDEFYLKLVDTVNIYITNLDVKSSFITSDNYNKLKINSRYKPYNDITISNKNANNIWSITATLSNMYSIPLILNKKLDNISKIELFKKIILAVLFNSICNIQSKFESSKLFDNIKRYKGKPPLGFQSNKIYIMKYYDLFESLFINENNKLDTNLLINLNDYISFYILLFNAYHSQFIDIKKTINTNINYLMNNSNKLTTNISITDILNNIIENRLLLDENINSDNSNKDDEILKLYSNNKPIINLIIVLFENLLITIKTKITTSSGYNDLCFPSSTSILTIQDAMNTKFATITNNASASAADAYNTISKGQLDDKTKTLINELNNLLRNYFNIVIFLLDNLKLNTNTAEIDTITTNFNFYNKEDIVKNTIQKRLTISCDYYSKYNKLDSKQLSYFKINADNVNYNFPILMIIFLIILGEPIFIKS